MTRDNEPNRIWNWVGQRFTSAFNTSVETLLRWVAGAAVIAAIGLIYVQSNRPPTSELTVNSMDGVPGYTFVTGVFSTAEDELAGSGSIVFQPPQIERIRVCRNLTFPQQDSVADVLATLEEKLSPCISITPSRIEADGVRYVVAPTEVEDLREVIRADRGGTETVPQFFCFCEERVIEKFLNDGGGTKWP